MAIDNMCYNNCNSTHFYSYNGTCYSTCPSGTYLTFTNVICSECSSVCLTCSNANNNCTSCSGTYFMDNDCLTQCPTGYYGNASLL